VKISFKDFFPLGIRMVNYPRKTLPVAACTPLQHVQITIGIAKSHNWPSTNASAITDGLGLPALSSMNSMSAVRIERLERWLAGKGKNQLLLNS